MFLCRWLIECDHHIVEETEQKHCSTISDEVSLFSSFDFWEVIYVSIIYVKAVFISKNTFIWDLNILCKNVVKMRSSTLSCLWVFIYKLWYSYSANFTCYKFKCFAKICIYYWYTIYKASRNIKVVQYATAIKNINMLRIQIL